MKKYLIFLIPIIVGCKTVRYQMMNYTTGVVRPIQKEYFLSLYKNNIIQGVFITKVKDKNGEIRKEIFSELEKLSLLNNNHPAYTDVRVAIVFNSKPDTIFCHVNGVVEHDNQFYYDSCFSNHLKEMFLDSIALKGNAGLYSDRYCTEKW